MKAYFLYVKRTWVFLCVVGHPTFNATWHDHGCPCGPAYNAFTYTAST